MKYLFKKHILNLKRKKVNNLVKENENSQNSKKQKVFNFFKF